MSWLGGLPDHLFLKIIHLFPGNDSCIFGNVLFILENESSISELSSYVEDSGEGRWTLNEAVELGIPIPVISSSLFARFRSRQKEPLSGKILSAMRRGFGGHKVEKL